MQEYTTSRRWTGTSAGKPSDGTASSRVRRLLVDTVKKLDQIRAIMESEGLREEAESISTVIADLCWQYMEIRGRDYGNGNTAIAV